MEIVIVTSEYDHLSEIRKFNLLWKHGKLLLVHSVASYRIGIYSLFDFYVMIVYDMKEKRTKKIKAIISAKGWIKAHEKSREGF
jgi:hypothetical protein